MMQPSKQGHCRLWRRRIGAGVAALILVAVGYPCVLRIQQERDRIRRSPHVSVFGQRFPGGFSFSIHGSGEPADLDLQYLKGMNKLHTLHLDQTAVSDDGLAFLNGLTKLREFSLYGTAVTDKGLLHLRALTGLDWVQSTETHVTNAGVADLERVLPSVRILPLADFSCTFLSRRAYNDWLARL